MGKLKKQQDAYGQALHDHFHGKGGFEVVERDDGGIFISSGPPAYLAEYRDWPALQKRAIRLARGRVLDVGCGAGRVALYLQGKGLDAVGIDISPLAIQVCKARGLNEAKVLSVTRISRRLGVFDTIVMYGNNFGLLGSFRRARWLLRRFYSMTGPAGRILAESNDPYPRPGTAGVPCHLEYHERNRRRGRMAGQLRFRIRYMTCATPYFDWLMVSKDEMRQIVAGTGWRIARLFESKPSSYIAVLDKERPL